MKAWQITHVGPPEEVLELVERPIPEAMAGELGVEVHAAAVGLPDLLMCLGGYTFEPPHPFTPGQEVAGTVTDAGHAPGFEPGQRVMGVTAFYRGFGGFAERALLVADTAWPIPDAMSDLEAAAFGIPFRTAYLGLVTRGQLRAGETLLVHGAAGGTGFAAVQLGKALGARVLAVAAGKEKCAFCRENGADDVIDRNDVDFVEEVLSLTGGGGADVVFDPVGGETYLRSLDCIAQGGRLLAVGFASGAWADAPTLRLVTQNVSAVGVMAVAPSPEVAAEMHSQLMDFYAAGLLRPMIARVLAFEELPDAIEQLETRRVSGKQVITVP
ncbi:MAG: NADPH:quinone oxidoreductase family protein [Deltaproteobacteria bacterium]|nr:NADPH:quinone oxidoreductase family protein [Deltaproteobacteria bacterium]MBW2421572.1 NADPH:quinone oxidoreductase family protein [Deltaproteobacteria bacterium]